MNPPESSIKSPALVGIYSPAARFRFRVFGLLLLCLFAFFWRRGDAPLFDLDEALYVGCARQMVLTGDWNTPRLNSRPQDRPEQTRTAFFEKPILVYWCAAGSMRLFGLKESSARLPVALTALFMTLAVTLAGRRWFGDRAGLLAGLVYALSPLTLLDARQMTTDGLLVLWFSLALFAFWNTLQNVKSWRWPLLFWTMCALAVLTKGAIGLLLPLLVIVIYLGVSFSPMRLRPVRVWWPLWRRLRPLLGLIVFFVIAAPWHLRMAQSQEQDAQGHTFYQEYLIRQHVGRFKGGDKVHNAPLPTYVVFFLVGFFPWACFAPFAFRWNPLSPKETAEAKRRAEAERTYPAAEEREVLEEKHETIAGSALPDSLCVCALPFCLCGEKQERMAHRFLLVWFWTIFVFFSLSAAKLPTYIVPAFPAAALLVGRWLDRVLEARAARGLQIGGGVAFAVAVLLVIAAGMAPRFTPANAPLPASVAPLALHLTLTLFVGLMAAWVCFLLWRQEKFLRHVGVSLLAVSLLIFLGIGITEGYAVAKQDILGPYQRLAAKANNLGADAAPILYYDIVPRRPSMLFYSRYAPIERKERPLRPYLDSLLSPQVPYALVLTSRRSYEDHLRAEYPEAQIMDGSGDWLLLRITHFILRREQNP